MHVPTQIREVFLRFIRSATLRGNGERFGAIVSWIAWAFFLLTVAVTGIATGQDAGGLQDQANQEATVKLNFPTEVEIEALVDYVSERLDVKILYDEQIANKTINIQAPGEIPVSSLLGLLQSALKMKDLALVDTETPGWKRIVQTSKLTEIARPTDRAEDAVEEFGAGVAVTQAFVLQHADPTGLEQLIKSFLTQPGANSIALKDQKVLIVTDYASNVVRISKLIELIDQPKPDMLTQFQELKHTEATALSQQLGSMLAARGKRDSVPGRPSATVEILPDQRTNQLILIGTQSDVDEVLEFIQLLDVPLNVSTETYSLQYASAVRLDALAKRFVDASPTRQHYRSVVDSDDNVLIVTTTPEIQEQIRVIQERIDVATTEARSPIRFYKLKNATAADVLETLRSIESPSQQADGGVGQSADGHLRLRGNLRVPGPNQPPLGPEEALPSPPALRLPGQEEDVDEGGAAEVSHWLPGQAHVTADNNTNTLIVVADPAVHNVYADLIKALDEPRPQVMIEARIVILDTSDDFSLGVEVSGGDSEGARRLFAFSSFGLSKVDSVTGALALIPGVGFNGTLVDPSVADVVVRALTRHRRAKVVSAPRLLVNDNQTGVLTSVAESPFTSVNASTTVATTSFAGFAQAGTTITVTPHISDGDHLQLDYRISLNAFTGSASPGVPPPRQTDEVESKVTIPDGHTIIVGGLNRTTALDTIDGMPFIEKIPLLNRVTSLESRSKARISLFVFLRPVILRDDKFRDLRFLSGHSVKKAGERGDFIESQPVTIR